MYLPLRRALSPGSALCLSAWGARCLQKLIFGQSRSAWLAAHLWRQGSPWAMLPCGRDHHWRSPCGRRPRGRTCLADTGGRIQEEASALRRDTCVPCRTIRLLSAHAAMLVMADPASWCCSRYDTSRLCHTGRIYIMAHMWCLIRGDHDQALMGTGWMLFVSIAGQQLCITLQRQLAVQSHIPICRR